MKIEPTERIDWPPPYKDATEKYASQVRLSQDSRSLVGYVAGQPFPILDDNDPHGGDKIIWNEVFRPISTDDYDLRWFDCDSEYWGKNRPYFASSTKRSAITPATTRSDGRKSSRFR